MQNKNNQKVLVVVAHPDDEVLGCGGTMAMHSLRGDRVLVLILGEGIRARKTPNSAGQSEEVADLRKAASRANKILGVEKLVLKDFPDNRFDGVPLLDLVHAIEEVTDQWKPDIVYTHHGADVNIDHRRTLEAVEAAIRPMADSRCRTALAFEVPSSTEVNFTRTHAFCPRVFQKLSVAMLDKKLKAMYEYKSEMRPFPHPRSAEYLRSLASVRGGQSGFERAESFELIYRLRD